jgi:hypothetical protein
MNFLKVGDNLKLQVEDKSEQLFKSVKSVYIALAAYVKNVAKEIGEDKAMEILSSSFDEIGTYQGKKLKRDAKKANLDANEAYELIKSIPKSIGINFMITQKDSDKIIARLDKCSIYESAKLVGLDPAEFCINSAIPYFKAVAKQLNLDLEYSRNKCKLTEKDFCEEQLVLKKL